MLHALAPLAVLFSLDPGPLCTAKDLKATLDVDFTVLPGPRSLVASPGKLWVATCAPEAKPRLDEVAVDAPIDFRRYVPLPDGRLVFGGTGGLVAIDPVTLQSSKLTTAPTYGVDKCWTAEEGKPVLGWDRDPRPGGRAGVIAFSRGGPCDYEAEATSTTMIVDMKTQAVRPATNVSALIVAAGAVWLGDGGVGCHEQQTPGTVFVRGFTGAFAPTSIGDTGKIGVVALGATSDGSVWALTGICSNGGAARGGNLYRASVAEVLVLLGMGVPAPWKAVEVPPMKGDDGVDDGQALVALVAKKNELHVARATDGDKLNWRVTKDGGKTWRPSRMKVPAPKVAEDLEGTLGVVTVHGTLATKAETWAWTDDGAFVRDNAKDAQWRKAF